MLYVISPPIDILLSDKKDGMLGHIYLTDHTNANTRLLASRQ